MKHLIEKMMELVQVLTLSKYPIQLQFIVLVHDLTPALETRIILDQIKSMVQGLELTSCQAQLKSLINIQILSIVVHSALLVETSSIYRKTHQLPINIDLSI